MSYYLPESYQVNSQPGSWDDSGMKDEWQREVYLMAYAMSKVVRAETILDVGCGSGFKTLRYLKGSRTTGVELEPTLSSLRKSYPDRSWLSPREVEGKFDLVVCADVIEHVLDPDELCSFVRSHAGKWIIISTPDRMREPDSAMGPPSNFCHVREWAFDEFGLYMRSQFDVVGQVATSADRTTMAAICEVR